MSIQLSRRSPRALVAIPRLSVIVACSLALLCSFASIANAQQLNIIVRVHPETAPRVIVEGNCAPTKTWSFRDSYAGVLNLGSRIKGFKLLSDTGVDIPVRRIAPGQFESAAPASKFRYEVNLAPPAQASDASRVSWLSNERGLLMLADLLPVSQPQKGKGVTSDVESKDSGRQSAIVRFRLPDFWAVYSNESENAQGEFEVGDASRAVFLVGTHLRSSHIITSGMRFGLVTDGEWAFADDDAMEMAGNVLKAHREVFGAMPSKQGTLILIPFPQTVAADKWSAETRGATVTLLLGKLPSKNAALAQLSVPLTHELFHFWVPNGLALDGDYDWFYEGFTIYQAARTAVRLDLLTFQEFLNAIARAYDAYAAPVDHDRWSIVEASQRRWTGGEFVVYQKSMLVAFLYDLKLRSVSRGKRSLDDVYREIFRQHHSAEADMRGAAEAERRSDGNDAAITALSNASGMQSFAIAFIRHAVVIDLPAELAPFGLRVERFGLRTRVSISESLTRQQRDLLRELGYNDYARSPRGNTK